MPSAGDFKTRILSGMDRSGSVAQQELHALLSASSASQPAAVISDPYSVGLPSHARDNQQEQAAQLGKQLQDADSLIQQGREALQSRRQHLLLCESELESAIHMATRLLHSLLLINATTGDLPGRLDKTQIKSIVEDLKRSISPAPGGRVSEGFANMALGHTHAVPEGRTVRFADSVRSPTPSRRPPPTPAPRAMANSQMLNAKPIEPRENIALPARSPGSIISAVVTDALGDDDFDTMVLARGHAVVGYSNRLY
jgi:hypothetical protein